MPRRPSGRSLALCLAICSGAAWGQEPPRDDGGTIRGRVQIIGDQFAMPVRRARVTLAADVGAVTSTTDADVDGQYAFDHLRPGTYRISASKAGFLPATSSPQRPLETSVPVTIRTRETSTLNLAMQRASALSGRFVDDEGTPLIRLDVTAERSIEAPNGTRSEVYHATTDDLGRFRVHTLPPGTI